MRSYGAGVERSPRFSHSTEGFHMKDWKNILMIVAVSAAVVYASNNDLPLVGGVIRRTIG